MSKITLRFSLAGTVVAVALIAACGIKPSGSSNSPTPTTPSAAFAPTNAILQQKCAPCHAAAPAGENIPVKDGDPTSIIVGNEAVVKANGPAIADAITTTDPKKAMPKARNTTPLADAETHQVLLFLGEATPAAGETVPTWDGGIADVVKNHCAPCHNDGRISPALVGHQDTVKSLGKAIAAAISATDLSMKMPPPAVHASTLSDDEKKTILTFIQAG